MTPASKWAADERLHGQDAAAPAAHLERLPTRQRVAVFLTVVVPLVALLGAIVLLWGRGIEWLDLGLLAVMYCIAGFGTTIGFHRLFTHRSFETPRFMRVLLAICGSMGAQGPVIRWCAVHRRHHQVSDHEGDPHSPHLHGEGVGNLLRGMLHAHVGWVFKPDPVDLSRSAGDLLEDPWLGFVDRTYLLWVFVGLLLPAAIGGWITGSWVGAFTGFLWGGLVRMGTMHHVTWSVNSVCHVWGDSPFRSNDQSTNNLPVALLSLGEGWHNNHHAFPTSARHGLRWWQFDSSYVLIRLMALCGLARKVRLPSPAAMRGKLKTA